jgi:citrate lyase subunit beta / citryl-CoA lyase
MHMRSWLLVPGDSDKKLARAATAGADVVVVDLEDTVAFPMKAAAREMACEWLQLQRNQSVDGRKFSRWVRINALDTRMWRDDLLAVMPGAPDGIVLPRSVGPESVQQLGAEIYEMEQRNGVASGTTRIVPMVSASPHAAMTIGSYVDAPLPRLAGLAWGADELAAALKATRSRDDKGNLTDPFRFVRAQTLLTAHARGIMPIDTLHADPDDVKGLKAAIEASSADGFAGMFAIHPAQVDIINAAFTLSGQQLDEARAVVDAFASGPVTGETLIDRRKIDQPNLLQAKRVLGMAGRPAY